MEKLHIAALFDNIYRPNTLKLDKLAKLISFCRFYNHHEKNKLKVCVKVTKVRVATDFYT